MQQVLGRDTFMQRKCLSSDTGGCVYGYIERFGERMPGQGGFGYGQNL